MAKFINKKERVFDLKLTTYGRHLLSVGTLKPTYYAFYDDNIIYDDRYAGTGRSATATITFSGLPAVDETITIVSTDGTSKAYVAKAATDTDEDPPHFSNTGNNKLVASALKTCIESANGHDGKIAVSKSGGVLTLTQAATGSTGDNTITETLDNATVTGFAGGVNDTRIVEPQNDIHHRIKNETQYLEGLTLFEGVGNTSITDDGGGINFFDLMNLPAKRKLRKDVFRFDSAIGDAYLDGDANVAPAWKVVALQSELSSSTTTSSMGQHIPQINIDANYIKKVGPTTFIFNPDSVRTLGLNTSRFLDNKVIGLVQNDPVMYVEEVNTENLTENYDIEVFEVITDATTSLEKLERKFFEKHKPQIVDGLMVSPVPIQNPTETLTTGSVEYYFDVLVDHEVDQKLACKGAEIFNKQSYYVNLDFDCYEEEGESLYFDIYGAVTEPEICQS